MSANSGIAQPQRRVAIITGSARGIGYATAARLLEDGLFVVINDIPSKASDIDKAVSQLEQRAVELGLVPAAGSSRPAVLGISGDVSKETDVENLVTETVRVFGRLDVMVANAGIALGKKSIIDAVPEEWEGLFSVNIRGVLLCYKHAARQMIKQNVEHGRIIGASSMAGLRGNPGQGAYCASKAAVKSMTQTLAMELADKSITVNAYAPGVIETDMTTTAYDASHGGTCSLVKQLYGVPNAKVASPDVVASIVSYLAKPEAHFISVEWFLLVFSSQILTMPNQFRVRLSLLTVAS
ncbi:hypothetical protein ONZ45_g8341 [Pleurotus djamor]|nr:hypothetical protein ONZ45_g8341 [Pleurotus djamor]